MSARVGESAIDTSVKDLDFRTAVHARAVMLVSNPCINDTRVIRAAEAVARRGFETVVLALSNEGETTEERRNGVLYRRLAPFQRISADSFSTSSSHALSNIPTYDLAWILLRQKPQRAGSGLETVNAKACGSLTLSREISRRLLIKTVKLLRALIPDSIRPLIEVRHLRSLFKSEAIKLRPKIVHAHDLVTLPAGAAIAKVLNAKLIYDAHELEVHRNTKAGSLSRKLRAYLERKYIRQCDAVITVCDSIADHLAREYSVKRPFVVMNAPNLEQGHRSEADLRSSLNLSSDTPLVAYVGRITIGRGIEQSVRALSKIPGYHLALVGPTHEPTVQAVQKLAEDLGVKDRFHIVPPVSPDMVVPFISSADVSVVPIQNVCLSYYYCLPNKLLESAIAGLPVVVSNFPELRRFVEIGGSGVVMNETDAKDMARAVREAYENRYRLVPNPERLKQLEYIYGWTTQEETLNALYASLTSTDA